MDAETQPPTTYNSRLSIAGPISVENSIKLKEDITYRILLMGLTGVGKSTFIECIGNSKDLGISKDQLDGVTQELTVYRVNNVKVSSWPVYLIDTPGFSDNQIPETRTLRMVDEWMKANKVDVVDRILYFDRITDNRMAGTKGKALDMFKAITGDETAANITVVTTMWDRLWNDRQREKANVRLEELRNNHWKEFIDNGADLLKFENTHESAMDILNQSLNGGTGTGKLFGFEEMCRLKKEMAKTSFAPNLYRNLIERRFALEQQVTILNNDMGDEEHKGNHILLKALSEEKEKTLHVLEIVEEELERLGPVELPEEFLEIARPQSIDTPPSATKPKGKNLIGKATQRMSGLFSRRRG
ncbi:hypothetical protein BJ165DRAFT_362845 [Panaeolus papilionaceus]|nr:hypothetical protein BJ165DRAFT_362845 [Panaeolus papilionaceus]